MPTDIAHIRYRNFMVQYRQFRDTHPDLPERGMLKLFAERVGVSDRYLSHIRCNRKNIGANLARTIEQALGLEHGWMDREHAQEGRVAEEGDAAELMFLETARMLYRSEPDEARRTLMALLRKKLLPAA
jgi:transcriptional regulator with XRE-family HTH domain